MAHIQARSIMHAFLFLSYILFFALSSHAAEKDATEQDGQGGKQVKITQYFMPASRHELKPLATTKKPIEQIQPRMTAKPKGTAAVDLTKRSQQVSSQSSSKSKEIEKALPQAQLKDTPVKQGVKRPAPHLQTTNSPSKKPKTVESEMQVSFLQGSNAHIQAYTQLINEAKEHVIVASWNVNFIPQDIFSSLLKAKNPRRYPGPAARRY